MTPTKTYYENLAKNVIAKFNLRGIEGYYCSESSDVFNTIRSLISGNASVSYGGSATLSELDIINKLKENGHKIFERPKTHDDEAEKQYNCDMINSDLYLMSSNAITFDGQLVNVDGRGNRVCNLIYGPKTVIIIAGMNKVVKTLDDAMNRVYNEAAPINAVRLERDTPCAKLGACAECLAKDCICANTVITRRSHIAGRIKVILVGESLGF